LQDMAIYKIKFKLFVASVTFDISNAASFVDEADGLSIGPLQGRINGFSVSSTKMSISVAGGGETNIEMEVSTNDTVLNLFLEDLQPRNAFRIEAATLHDNWNPTVISQEVQIPQPFSIPLF